jgi:hypothetical protein
VQQQWTPIVAPSDTLATAAWDAVDAIANSIVNGAYAHTERAHRGEDDALLYAYLSVIRNDPKWGERAIEVLNREIEHARYRPLGLYSGICGLGWVVEHVSQLLGAEGGEDELPADDQGDESAVDDVDASILAELRRHPMGEWPAPYDLISGLVGYGVYFLERLPHPVGVDGIELVVGHLDALSVNMNPGIAWHTPHELIPEWQRVQYPDGSYNLGVAHGIPGVIYLLNQVCSAGISKMRAEAMLEEAVDWLITQRRPAESSSWFASQIRPGQRGEECRQAWCYGDLGIVSVLLPVVGRTKRAAWQTFSAELLEHCLTRAADHKGIDEASLCHGAAGNAHMFNRIYQMSHESRCRDAAVQWFERAIEMRGTGTDAGGFLALRTPGGTRTWEASPSFLDGAVGIALALAAGLTAVEPCWDRLLLLSERPNVQQG